MSGPPGLESGTVRVVPYDPAWPALFAAEAERIAAALDGLPLRLEQMGARLCRGWRPASRVTARPTSRGRGPSSPGCSAGPRSRDGAETHGED